MVRLSGEPPSNPNQSSAPPVIDKRTQQLSPTDTIKWIVLWVRYCNCLLTSFVLTGQLETMVLNALLNRDCVAVQWANIEKNDFLFQP